MKSLDAESLVNFIHDTVTRIGFDWNYCVAQCYDGASVMSESFSGVQARLRAKSPQAFYIHCHAHKLNLVIASCVESVGTVGTFFSLVQTLYAHSFPTATLGISCLLRSRKLPNCKFWSWKEVLPHDGLTGIDLYRRLDSDMNAF